MDPSTTEFKDSVATENKSEKFYVINMFLVNGSPVDAGPASSQMSIIRRSSSFAALFEGFEVSGISSLASGIDINTRR